MANWYRRVFLLALPLIFSNLTQPLLSTVDTVLSGHLPGAAALGGVAVGGIFFNAIYWTFGFLRMTTTGLVAQAHGARSHEQLRVHFLRAILLAVLTGTVLLAVQKPIIAISVHMLGASQAVAQNAQLYCHIRIWSAPAALVNYVVLGYLLGRQRARIALVLQAVVNVVNIVTAVLLVLRLHWGVAGVAAATMTADWAGCALGVGLARTALHRRPEDPRLSWRELLHGPHLRHLFALNRDIFLRTLSLVAAYAWFTRTGARLGDATLAANAVLMNMFFIVAYGLDGFANATEALVGESIGARKLDHYRAVLRASTAAAFAVALLTSFVYLLAGSHLVALFTNVEAVRILARRFLPWTIALPVLSVWAFQFDGVFIGATRARELRDSMILSFGIFLGLAIVLEREWGNHGLWCAFCTWMVVRGATLAARLQRVDRIFAEPAPMKR
jgi:MATE family multidrug resistance protein